MVSKFGLIWLRRQEQPDTGMALRLCIAALALAEAGALALAAGDAAQGGGAVGPANPLWEALAHSLSVLLLQLLCVMGTHEDQVYAGTLRSSAGVPAKLLAAAAAVCGTARRSLECAPSDEAMSGDREHANAELSGGLHICAALQQSPETHLSAHAHPRLPAQSQLQEQILCTRRLTACLP